MINSYDLASVYDEYIISNNESLPRGLFEKGTSSVLANERLALSFIKYACENYLGWDAPTMHKYLTLKVVEYLKLTPVMQYIQVPEFGKFSGIEYIAEKIYPRLRKSTREQAIETYEMINKNPQGKYPRSFFEGLEGRERAKFCLQQVLSDRSYMYSQQELYEMFVSPKGIQLLKKYKLYPAISPYQLFRDPLDYLHESLPYALKSNFLFGYYRFIEAIQ